jgi:hypothetical protein|tara:strand:+ start:2067 stop:2222 length:156 start_codon:yes stop_codon:yes gene_type:complete
MINKKNKILINRVSRKKSVLLIIAPVINHINEDATQPILIKIKKNIEKILR